MPDADVTSRLALARIAARVRLAVRRRSRTDRLDEAGRAAWQEERLRQLRDHAVRRSPLYGARLRGLERAPLRELPVTTKHDVVERFDELVTDRTLRYEDVRAAVEAGQARLGRYRLAASSGSSGRPGLFAFDEAEWVGLIADAARARSIAGRPAVDGRIRTARIGSPSPLHLSRQVGATLQDPRTPSLTLSAAQDLADLITPLQEWQPHVLTGYPSVLGEVADAQRDGRLHIRPVQVFTGGEQLTAGVRRAIEAAWGTQPFDQYATTEAGFVAIECRDHDGLHVLDDHVVVEVVDAEGRAVPPGTEGERVLVTVLGSRTVPLIRYELDDVAVVAEGRCRCGRRSPRLRSLATGIRALLRLPGADGADVRLHPVAVTSVLDAAPVRGWQVIQERERLRVLVVGARPGFDPNALGDELRRSLVSGGARVSEIRVEPAESLVRAASGKASLVISDTSG